VGINNRDLKTFEVDIETSIVLGNKLPKEILKISESGISDVESVKHLREHGFKGFLMGENFMRTENPAKTCEEFIALI
ncbi:MAG: indole-3-glycerol-phosphate synthase TrpC, partial [Lachnospirales bacterium]